MSDEAAVNEPLEDEADLGYDEEYAAPFPFIPVLVVAAAIVAAAVLGAPVHLRAPAVVTLAPLAAIIAAVALCRPADAAVAAGAGTLVGLGLANVLGNVPLSLSGSGAATESLVAAVVAAALAFVARLALDRAERLRVVFVAAGLALVVASMWFAVVTTATQPAKDGTTFAGMMSSAPAPGPEIPVQGAYLALVQRLRTGAPYYASAAGAIAEGNAAYAKPDDLHAPLTIPGPALYLTLSRLPGGGLGMLLAALVVGTAAVGGAFLLASQFADTPIALASASAVAGYVAGVALTIKVLDAEPWAGALGVLALGLLAASREGERGPVALGWAAASAAMLAALVREPAALFLLAGLAVTLADEESRARRAWVPWAIGSAAAAVALVAHARAAASALAAIQLPAGGAAVPVGVPAAFTGLALVLGVAVVVVWVVALLGLAGAVIAPCDAYGRVMLAGSLLAGVATYLVLPAGSAGVIAPTLLACVPLVLVAIPGAYAEEYEDDEPEASSEAV